MNAIAGQALFGAVVPGAIAGGVLLLGARTRGGRVAGALAAAVGYVAAEWGLVGRPPFPPVDVTHWPFYFAPALAALVAIEPLLARRGALEWFVRALAGVAAAYLLLRPLSDGALAWEAAAAGALLFLLWSSLVVTARALPDAQGFFAAAVLAGAASVVAFLSGSAFLAQMGGGLAAALGAGFLLALFGRCSPAAASGAASVAGGLVACLVLCGRYYADVPLGSALLLVAGPVLSMIVAATAAKTSALARAAALLAIAGAGGAAVAIAFANFEPSGY